MNRDEIKEQCLMNEQWQEKAQGFFEKRKKQLLAKEYPVKLDEPPYAHFCLVPLGSRSEKIIFNDELIRRIKDALRSSTLRYDCDCPLFEGHMFYEIQPNNGKIATNVLNIFYDGGFEIIFGREKTERESNGESHIIEGDLERNIVKICYLLSQTYNGFFSFLPPFGVFYNIKEVMDKKMCVYPHNNQALIEHKAKMGGRDLKIYKNELEAQLYFDQELTTEKNIGNQLKPLFDPFSRSVGKHQSPNYEEDGQWKEQAS